MIFFSIWNTQNMVNSNGRVEFRTNPTRHVFCDIYVRYSHVIWTTPIYYLFGLTRAVIYIPFGFPAIHVHSTRVQDISYTSFQTILIDITRVYIFESNTFGRNTIRNTYKLKRTGNKVSYDVRYTRVRLHHVHFSPYRFVCYITLFQIINRSKGRFTFPPKSTFPFTASITICISVFRHDKFRFLHLCKLLLRSF